ncbi:DUF1000-domain-containing protein [Testicularia cyperi]|uniref:DUF1000-domain-containing protein n=1 Tax=Testicularia cyperi TaxID=1882483 RepID=A0A317XZY6_9BASI|nr:DUF1000-domain-containing protein [Testicularia cyperi]
MSHHHHHGDSCGHEHDHNDDSHVKADEGDQDFLYTSIDRERVITLNEAVSGSGVSILKTWSSRLDPTPACVSDADDQLIIHVPFTSTVKLTSLLLRPTGNTDETPTCIRLIKNHPVERVDFDDVSSLDSSAYTSTLDSIPTANDTKDVVTFPLKQVKWSNTDSITLFIEGSIGADVSAIQFLGFKGKASGYSRAAPATIVYESAPQLKDHAKIPGTEANTHSFGQ